MATADLFDCVVVGAGPAGLSALSWASQLGWRCAIVERAAQPCASLLGLDFAQDWVLGQPHATLRSIGERLAAHALHLPGVAWHLGREVEGLEHGAQAGWRLRLSGGAALRARSLVLATGVRPVRPAAYFDAAGVLDAISLTARRAKLPPGRVLLLGGGDNALENAAYLAGAGHALTLWTRGDWRGRVSLVSALAAHPDLVQRRHTPLPIRLRPSAGGGFEVESAAFGMETFEQVAVLFGYEPEPAPWAWLAQALQADERARGLRVTPGRPIEALGVFVAGDASGRWHPCVQTALADGVTAAQQASAYLHPGGAAAAEWRAAKPAPSTLNSQVLQLTGLRFGANLGILAHERDGPQPIQVDAELNLGEQPALARDADLGHVLDYRKVRQIIIDECTAEHTDLLESLLAKLCVRLMRLPGVLGVRIRVAKLEIFDDCEVAIRCEAGVW
jgi:dihydroneopterin aldolase